jgi:hypothetical protein
MLDVHLFTIDFLEKLDDSMDRSNRHLLISTLTHLRSEKRRRIDLRCPNCQGEKVDLVSERNDLGGLWKEERYFCCDCECEWDWTSQRQVLRGYGRMRPPRWMNID